MIRPLISKRNTANTKFWYIIVLDHGRVTEREKQGPPVLTLFGCKLFELIIWELELKWKYIHPLRILSIRKMRSREKCEETKIRSKRSSSLILSVLMHFKKAADWDKTYFEMFVFGSSQKPKAKPTLYVKLVNILKHTVGHFLKENRQT